MKNMGGKSLGSGDFGLDGIISRANTGFNSANRKTVLLSKLEIHIKKYLWKIEHAKFCSARQLSVII